MHFAATGPGHETFKENGVEGHVTASYRGRSSTTASRRRGQFKGLEDGYGYGDAGPPQPQQQRLRQRAGVQRRLHRREEESPGPAVVAPLQVAAPLQDRRVLLLVVGTSAFTAAAGGQRRRPPIPVTNPPRHPPLPVEEGFECTLATSLAA